MNPNLDPKRDDALLDALLSGEPWTEANATAERAALAAFRARQRRRRIQFRAMSAAACAIFAAGAAWMARHDTTSGSRKDFVVANSNNAQTPTMANPTNGSAVTAAKSDTDTLANLANLPQHISEEQMLALFPKGSCIIAEINGQKQLIFFNRKIANEGAPYQPGS